MVDDTARRLHRLHVVHRLRHVGGISERALRVRSVSLAVLCTGPVGRLRARVVWPAARVVAGAAAVFTGAADSSVPRTLPLHLLLLPRRVLQGLLGRPAELLRRRAAQGLSRRELVPADSAERPPLLFLRRGDLHLPALLRRVAGAVVHRSGDGSDASSALASAPSCC